MVKKKEDWEKKGRETASISLKKTISFSLGAEIEHFVNLLDLGGYTELNKEFLASRCNKSKKEFEKYIVELILKEANIEERKYSEEFRLFLAIKIRDLVKTKEQKLRWENFIKNREYE